jgi:signal transduction histidine kinase
MTDRKRELIRTRERADFDRLLLGIVSHDLQNPITSIGVSAQLLLRREELDERTIKAAARILSSVDRVERLIRDLLDLTRARLGGSISIKRRRTDVRAVTAQIVEELQIGHPDRIIEVLHTGDGHGLWDPDRLGQVLSNLLKNAIKYSYDKTPVRVATHGEQDCMVIEVHNEGRPIPDPLREHLFEPFHRGAGEPDPTSRSIGLGLYIVDQIVRVHGGSIQVTSLAEQGTTFRVTLPRQPA